MFKNIIVRLPNWVGDLIMALPILEDVKPSIVDSGKFRLVFQDLFNSGKTLV